MRLLAGTGELVVAGLIAALLLVWILAVERRHGGWRAHRLLLAGLAVGALFLLAARPAVDAGARGGGTVVLLTAGTDGGQVERAREVAGSGAHIYALPDAGDWGSDAEPTADLGAVLRRHPGMERLVVVGSGLAPWELARVPGVVETVAAQPPTGVLRAVWPRWLELGRSLVVEGLVRLEPGASGRLSLAGPGGEEDSVEVTGESPFRLSGKPRRSGRLLYRLRLETESALREEGSLDVEVVESEAPAILWLEDAPSFESRGVRDWIAEANGRLVVRSRLTRGAVRLEGVGLDSDLEGPLAADALASFDLLVVDPAAWAAMSAVERRSVEEAVAAGLGLLLRDAASGQGLPTGSLFGSLRTRRLSDLGELAIRPQAPGLGPLSVLRLPAAELETESAVEPLVSDEAGRLLVALRAIGSGRLGVALVERTYRWVLAGDERSHREYWSFLVEHLARRRPRHWTLPPGPIRVDEPLEVALESDAGAPPAVALVDPAGGRHPVAPRQLADEPTAWRLTVWPRAEGWHSLVAGDLAPVSFYAQPPGSWLAVGAQSRRSATQLRAATGEPGGSAADHPSPGLPRELPAHWPFGLFALSLAALWAEDHWRGGGQAGARRASMEHPRAGQ